MSELGISEIVVRANRMCGVKFATFADEDVGYVIHAVAADRSVSAEVAATSDDVAIGTVGPLALGVEHILWIEADDTAEVGPTVTFTPRLETTYANVIRQQLFDDVRAAEIVNLFGDRWGRPVLMDSKEAVAKPMPALEILRPKLVGSTQPSVGRRSQTYQCSMRAFDTAQDEDSGAERCGIILEKVRRALDKVRGLGLSWLGVQEGSWGWAEDEHVVYKGIVGVECILTVTLPTLRVGKMCYEA
jgi:hypothetical protein